MYLIGLEVVMGCSLYVTCGLCGEAVSGGGIDCYGVRCVGVMEAPFGGGLTVF